MWWWGGGGFLKIEYFWGMMLICIVLGHHKTGQFLCFMVFLRFNVQKRIFFLGGGGGFHKLKYDFGMLICLIFFDGGGKQ